MKYSAFFRSGHPWRICRGSLCPILAVATAFLIACGDDNGSSAPPTSSSDKPKSSNSSEEQPQSSSSHENMGTMTDERDGQTYKTVTIGSQTWMAENLNYETENSSCYNREVKCTKFGRFYTWAAAMDSVGIWGINGKGCGNKATCKPTYPVRGVCPSGWHIPSKAEFDRLVKFVGGKTNGGKKLKSTSGWHIYDDVRADGGNGSDDYGFNALSSGFWFVHIDDAESYEYNDYVGEKTGFWTTDEDKRVREHEFDDLVYIMSLDNWDGDVSIDGAVKYYRYSVRCIKD